MRNYQKVLAVIALSGMCFAQAAKTDTTAAKPAKKHVHHVAKSMKAMPAKNQTADELRELKEQLNQQQSSMQAMQQQLQQTQQQLQQTQQQLKSTEQTAQQGAACCEVSHQTAMQVQKVQADLSDVKAAVAADTAAVQKITKKVDYLENPNSIAYKGVHITPGGQVDVTEFWRQRAALDDIATSEGAIALERQFNGGYNANLGEAGISARNSRVALKIESNPTKSVNLVGVFEWDMTALPTGANNNQTTSVSPRFRQGWVRAKWANGWKLTAGQDWNLITLNRRGTDADSFFAPNSIDQAIQSGGMYLRAGEIRVGKTFAKNFDFAMSITNAAVIQSSVNQTNNSLIEGVAAIGNGSLGNSAILTNCATPTAAAPCTNGNLYSTNAAPDMALKLAYDSPKFGHYEIKALGRAFRDRVAPTSPTVVSGVITVPNVAGNDNLSYGWGLGGGVFVPVVAHNKMNAYITGMYGKGISRYFSDQGPDFIVRTATNDGIQPEKMAGALVGIESHPAKRTELDISAGTEYYWRNLYTENAAGELGGYGVPTSTNIGCYYENFGAFLEANPGSKLTALPSCTGNNRNAYSLKVTGYYDLYTGRVGTLRYGLEYNYAGRATWSGNGGLTTSGLSDPFLAGKTSLSPKGDDNMIMTVIRFILP